jgi:hypothetical protein
MKYRLRFLALLLLGALALGVPGSQAEQPGAAPGAAASASLETPKWKVGDSWVVETEAERVQTREPKAVVAPARVRWKFQVAKIEKLGDRDCYRIDIECLAKGRLRPASSLWVDKETFFLRQFQTQLAVDGQMRTITESYDAAAGQSAPVVTPINALPLGLPAFGQMAKAKGLDGKPQEFKYTSSAAPVGAKAVEGSVKFAHSAKQDVHAAGAKSLGNVVKSFSKAIDSKPISEVQISTPLDQVTQLWQKDVPWPVYSTNGSTQAWLVSESSAEQPK